MTSNQAICGQHVRSEEHPLTTPGALKMLKRLGGGDATARSPLEVALLDEEGLMGILDRMLVLSNRRGEGLEAGGSTREMLDEAEEEAPVEAIKARVVYVEEFERALRLCGVDQ